MRGRRSKNHLEVESSRVYVSESLIDDSQAGRGLFAKVAIKKGCVVCSYGGQLVDSADALYLDPTYIVSWEYGSGYKLMGDDIDGDLGHFANAVHPENDKIQQNARFMIDHKNKYELEFKRARFYITAKKDIEVGEEIIVDYGPFYWGIMDNWFENGRPDKPQEEQARDERAKKRQKIAIKKISSKVN